ncbi:hypothetical protein L226DRAFT_535052 [Lentinus tigrinus ALCF2SS1-7]|uniref:Uncharacterized protein n=1 Tax=Lentinus tigrinus ALCF2SS1-6 TaxID=1328759 RepID=A0A5C2SAE2_9APHY|nr:hypothetical protein L227DRAFT_575650 [Lentinus tigrinus ALCF2SS1-6]RPD74831.1 hypothetical protein L226DRAFT_535052 [Lentinus tigrinus ALCF2SS1-7]
MYSTLLSVALFSTLAIQGALADFTVNTPAEITQCEPVQLTWADTGAKTYNVALVSSADPCDTVIAEYGDHSTNHITVTPAVEAGQKVMLSVIADDDDEGWSGEFTVKAGNDTSCLPKVSTSASASSSAGHSSSSAVASSGTTLVVNPAAAPTTASSAPAAPSSTDGASVVGAAGSGILDNGAFGSVRFSASTVALSAIAAVAALAF